MKIAPFLTAACGLAAHVRAAGTEPLTPHPTTARDACKLVAISSECHSDDCRARLDERQIPEFIAQCNADPQECRRLRASVPVC